MRSLKSGCTVDPLGEVMAGASVSLFFDIVGFDEGTCGRRLAGSGGFKASDTRLKPSCSHRSFTYPYVIDFVQSGSLR